MERRFNLFLATIGILVGLEVNAVALPPACQADIEITNAQWQSEDTVYACVGMPLQFEDVSLLEGLLSVRTWEFGDGSQAVDGLLNAVTQYAYSTEGTYTMSLTVESLLCPEMTATRTVIVLGQPQFSTASADIDCAGNCNGEASVQVLSVNAPYYNYEWDDQFNQTTDTAVGLCAGTYHAIITDDFGCTDLMTNPVDIFEPQPLQVSIDAGDTLYLCPDNGLTGVPLTIDGGAGNNQSMWTTSSAISVPSAELMEFTPNELSLDLTYSVTVMDNNGCSAEDSLFIASIPSSLEGYVTMQNTPCENCEVFRYHFEPTAGVWHVLESVITDATGAFDFGPVNNFEKFVLMADPEDIAHPMGVETFYPQKHDWVNADVFNMCGDNYYKHIPLIPPMNFNGTNTLSGTVWYSASGKMQTEEDPIPLIDVVVEKTPPGQAQGRVSTNNNGDYEFQYVPNSDTTYTLFVNMPGVPNATTYEILANNGGETFEQLDFCLNIDSTEINICQVSNPVITGEPVETEEEAFVLYPNPNNGMFTIETGKFALTPAEIRIVDPAGRLAFRKHYTETPITINMVNVADGYYTVQMVNETDTQSSAISVIR